MDMSVLFTCSEHFKHGSAQTEMCVINELKTEYRRVDKIGGKCDAFKCDVCGEEMSKANKSRHMKLDERNEH